MSFDQTWHNATVDEQQDAGQPPEKGLYTTELIDAAAVTAKASGKDWVILEFRALDGGAEGHAWKVFQGFGSPQQAGFTKRVCRDLGVDIDNVTAMSELDEQLKQQIGRYFTVEVKQNGEYRNTYIQGTVSPESFTLQQQGEIPVTDEPPAGAQLAAAPAGNDDDIPFLWDGPRDFSDRYHANR